MMMMMMMMMMRVMMMGRMTETACRSLPRRGFDLCRTDETYGQRNNRSYLMEKFARVQAAEPMALKLFDPMDLSS